MRNHRILVLGAGLAGLSAALELVEGGRRVTVLEAGDHVGGRVRSIPMPDGGFAEAGGEWIFDGDDELVRLAHRFGLDLVPTGLDFARREAPGADPDAQARFLAAAVRELRRRAPADLDGATLGAFLGSVGGEEAARRAVTARLQGTCAVDLEEVALGAMAPEGFASSARPTWRIAQGNQALAERIARSLPDVRLDVTVDAVEWSGDRLGVAVRTGDRVRILDAGAAVVALPLPIVRRLRWDPAPPAEVGRAWAAMPVGVASKLVLPLAFAPVARARQSVDEPFWWWTTAGPDGEMRPWVTAFAGSPAAHRALDLGRGDPSPWVARLLELDPELRPAGRPILRVWSAEPFALGAYSAISNEVLPHLDALERRFGAVVLAGEHTAGIRRHGTMEGALRSGRRAARSLLERTSV